MKHRLRTNGTTREEIHDDADFVGAGELRVQISAARVAGDSAALARLQRRHREMRLAARDVRSSFVYGSGGTSTPVHQTRTTGVASDLSRVIEGYALTWGLELTRTSMGRDDRPYFASYDRHAFDSQLARVDPTSIALLVNHSTQPVGRCLSFSADDVGLRVVAEVFDEPAGDLALEGIERGDVRGFSTQTQHSQVRQRGETRRGLRCFDISESELTELSLATEPADEGARIELVAGETPQWRYVQDALDRDARLAESFGFRPRRGGGGYV